MQAAPRLPPELELEIFLLAAYTEPLPRFNRQQFSDTFIKLPQVCRRAQEWFEPILYERICLLQTYGTVAHPFHRFLRTIDSRPASFFAQRVKYIYLDYKVPLHAVQRILSVCTGAVSVGCHHPYTNLAPFLAPLPLQKFKRLLISGFTPVEQTAAKNATWQNVWTTLSKLFGFPPPGASSSCPAFDAPWCESLTHIGLSSSLPAAINDLTPTLASFPALTHLAIGYRAFPADGALPTLGTIVSHILGSPSPRIRVLLMSTESKTDYNAAFERLRRDGFADPEAQAGAATRRVHVRMRPLYQSTWEAWGRVRKAPVAWQRYVEPAGEIFEYCGEG